MSKFFTYNQNNTGGAFDYVPDEGISNYVIIEAENADSADALAQSIGLYFDGWGDCSCCGTRWTPFYGTPDNVPMVYATEVYPEMPPTGGHKWIKGYEGFIHYLDGSIKGFWK